MATRGQPVLSYERNPGANMEPDEVLKVVSRCRLVAIVRLDDLQHAAGLIAALLRGGVQAIEFTLTNPQAPHVVRQMLEQFEQFHDGRAVLGIGSVRTVSDARLALEAGSQFLVSPVTEQSVIRTAREAGVPIMPGAYTPTEIAQAVSWGAELVKLFPARCLGPGYVKDVLAPMPDLKLMPTGGIDTSNIHAYLAAGAAAVGVGGQLVNPAAVQQAQWAEIERVARSFVSLAEAVN
jgi:2-dehydro-3-deoxyphosphogluconate aldolase / (4S)-4-hydroxy-2-oxoglutarate aldolase